ncbi:MULTISPECIES: cytochrome C [unclassified Novosphingobium]|uniref:cytochrome C n=1 Tax=Novosphingobium TaxID=165696 RepID=UPI00146CEBFE|nr:MULTISPECIES: cytochrome C [unclassified Novosphingobium]NKJ44105.1 mono/diheme cytochrome c family protein [Novosphingobium sp. SG720]NMN04879.1 mono/diheme cytochrome c family protein [Novosphingobium sp. SG919]NMN87172.1 mono/diheme cytochrome c family protein [Novosphingobium sp. SG916]
MKARPLALVLVAGSLAATLATVSTRASPVPAMRGVADPVQARTDYQLKCQGCHRPDGSGDGVSNPPMQGVVAQFLGVPGGRDFIARVPGVATTDLDDRRLANLVNWTLYTFDARHMPADFRPYTARELGALRQHPLRLERAATRARLVEGFTTKQD